MRRLDEPLRVAIAGRVKAGKSTLLNALVGERLAATDAGECTRVVTWYRNALGYKVVAELGAGGSRDLAFHREDGALAIDLGGLTVDAIERIEVGWPSQKLTELTLIDTPGLASASEGTSERTERALLDDEGDGPGEADAVLYLMRHLHRSDVDFLEAFVDRSVAHASPINAIVVLSRADEIGAARPDALDSARTVAARYGGDARVRELASGVVPVAGLIAETGATLREAQFGWLREVAALPEARRDHLLLSVDRFRDPDAEPARRGDPRRAARTARAVRAAARRRPDRRRRGAHRHRAVRGPPRAVGDPRAATDPGRALRRARPGAQGPLGAGRPAADRRGSRSRRRRRRAGHRAGGRPARGIVAGARPAPPPPSRADRRRRADARASAPKSTACAGPRRRPSGSASTPTQRRRLSAPAPSTASNAGAPARRAR